jgi:2-polyprenyl-6-methoxyphenol hydroxylase-like FAD-dependent oxidoreductase
MSRASIIGAGIGGLVAALGLQRQGWQVTVHERAAAPAVVGAGLSLFRNAFTALDTVGAGDAVRALGGPQRHLTAGQRRPDGRWLSTTPPGALRDLRVVHRADLHAALAALLKPGTVVYNHAITADEVDAADVGGERLTPAGAGGAGDERTEAVGSGWRDADVVIAADGLRSCIRASWPGDPGIRYSGYTSWRGVTREPVDVLGGAGESLGRGDRFGLAPLPDGRVYWFGVSSMPAGIVFGDEFAEVRRRFAGWHAPIADLLDATGPAAVIRTDIHDLAAPLPTFRRGRTVLLGDAAHAMTPDLGQGAAQAMEDAATLSHLLGMLPIDGALDAYDRQRRARTQPLAARARRLGQILQSRNPLRDTALRLIPPAVTARQLAAIQSWTVS